MGLAWLASELQGSPSLCLPRDEIRDLCAAGSQGSELRPLYLHGKRFMNSPNHPRPFLVRKVSTRKCNDPGTHCILLQTGLGSEEEGGRTVTGWALSPTAAGQKSKDSVSLGGNGLALPSDTS